MQSNIFRETDGNTRNTMVRKWFKKVTGGAGLIPMVGISSGYLRVIFGIAEYQAGFGENCDYDEALVGFMGDRVNSKRPLTINLSKRVGWMEVEKAFTGEATLRTFYSDQSNERKFYTVKASDSTSKLLLPALLQVPREHVKWLIEKSRTPWQYHEKLLKDLGGDQPDKRPTQLAVCLAFLQRACTAGSTNDTKNKSVGEMKVEPVFAGDFPVFDKWITARLDTVLGPAADSMSVIQNVIKMPEMPPTGQSPFDNSNGGGGGSVSQTGGSLQGISGSKEKAALSDVQLAALQGWCHARYLHEIPKVWTELQSTTDVEDMRDYIDAAWEESRKTLQVDLSECNKFYLDDLQVKEWKQCKFAPGGTVLVWDYLMKGMSILLMSMFSASAKLNSKEQDRIYDDTINTRTEEQAARRTKKEPREPPRSWHTLKYLINTYAIMLHALFSHRCPHFETVWAVRDVLASMRELTSVFTHTRCKLIIVHIMKDSKRYFSVKLMPKDFAGVQAFHQIAWPLSHLADVAKYIFQQQFTALEVADVPHKWKEDPTTDNNKRKATDQGARAGDGQSQWQGNSNYNRGSSNSGGLFGRAGGPDRAHDKAPDKISSRIGGLINECKQLCPTFGYRELRNVGGMDGRNFPRLAKYDDDRGNNSACNAGILGICHFHDGTCKFRRVDYKDISNEFADAVANFAGPPLQRCIEVFRSGGNQMGNFNNNNNNNGYQGGTSNQQGGQGRQGGNGNNSRVTFSQQQGGGMGRGAGWYGPRRF